MGAPPEARELIKTLLGRLEGYSPLEHDRTSIDPNCSCTMKSMQRAASQPALTHLFRITSDVSPAATPPPEMKDQRECPRPIAKPRGYLEFDGEVFGYWSHHGEDRVETPWRSGFLIPFEMSNTPAYEETAIQKEKLLAAARKLLQRNRPCLRKEGSNERIIVDELDDEESALELGSSFAAPPVAQQTQFGKDICRSFVSPTTGMSSGLRKLYSGSENEKYEELAQRICPESACRFKRISSIATRPAESDPFEKKVNVMEQLPD